MRSPGSRWRISRSMVDFTWSTGRLVETENSISAMVMPLLVARAARVGQFLDDRAGVVDVAQGLQDALRVDRHRTPLVGGEEVVPGQALDVAIEDDAHELARRVDGGAARAAADDVAGVHEVEGLGQVHARLLLGITRWQDPRPLVAPGRRAVVE